MAIVGVRLSRELQYYWQDGVSDGFEQTEEGQLAPLPFIGGDKPPVSKCSRRASLPSPEAGFLKGQGHFDKVGSKKFDSLE